MRPSIRYNGNYVILLMSIYVVVRNIYTRKALVRQIGNVFFTFTSHFFFSRPKTVISGASCSGPNCMPDFSNSNLNSFIACLRSLSIKILIICHGFIVFFSLAEVPSRLTNFFFDHDIANLF